MRYLVVVGAMFAVPGCNRTHERVPGIDIAVSNGTPELGSVLGDAHPLNCSFGTANALYWGVMGFSLPMNEEVAQKRGGKFFLIRTQNDLAGHIRISSAQEALDYCRFVSQFPKEDGPNVSEGNLTLELLSDVDTLAVPTEYAEMFERFNRTRRPSPSWFKRHRVPRTSVQQTPFGWRITRPMVSLSCSGKAAVTWLFNEEILQAGQYRCSATKTDFPEPDTGWPQGLFLA